MKWWNLASRMRGSSRPKDPLEAKATLVAAYKGVFGSHSPDAEVVLADLADFTGFYRVNPPGTPPEDRAFSDGMRAAFGRLFNFLHLTDEEKAALGMAARDEAMSIANKEFFEQ